MCVHVVCFELELDVSYFSTLPLLALSLNIMRGVQKTNIFSSVHVDMILSLGERGMHHVDTTRNHQYNVP